MKKKRGIIMRNDKLKVLIIGGLTLTLTTSNPLQVRACGCYNNPLQSKNTPKISVENM